MSFAIGLKQTHGIILEGGKQKSLDAAIHWWELFRDQKHAGPHSPFWLLLARAS